MGEAVRPARAGAVGEWPQKSPKGRLWALALLGLATTVILAVMAREPAPPGEEAAEPPAEVLGRWTTGDPRYADRHISVSRDAVSVGLGPGIPSDEGSITAVRTWKEGSSQVVRLEYSTVEGEQLMELILHGPDRMHLRNPVEVVWNRSR
ncbi:MAG: hypothetical protein AMXMBFR53_43410 [Gemmatimonadota bacterium]